MEKIASFTINHLVLEPGIYVSRKDHFGETVITTFDLRMTAPNREPVMNTAELHTIEHLGATYLRSREDWKDRVVYFGPMGCRTGCYVLLEGDLTSREIVPLITGMFEFIRDYEGDIPGLRRGTAAIIWTRISAWPNGSPPAIWRRRCTASRRNIWYIRNDPRVVPRERRNRKKPTKYRTKCTVIMDD